MDKLKTTSQLKKASFNFSYSKKIAKWFSEGLDKNQIYNKCIVENELGIASIERRKELTNHLYQRIAKLDSFLLKKMNESDIVTSKFILIYAIAKNDRLFTEFLFEIYRDRLLGEKKYISMDDFDLFFTSKKESNLTVYKWSKTTIELLCKAYRKMLVDSSLGLRKIKNIYVSKMIIHPDIEKHITQLGDQLILKSILGEK
jgi:hypothetical protein